MLSVCVILWCDRLDLLCVYFINTSHWCCSLLLDFCQDSSLFYMPRNVCQPFVTISMVLSSYSTFSNLFYPCHSIAKNVGCFQQSLFVWLFVGGFLCGCVCQHDNFWMTKHRMMKLGGRCIAQKSQPSSNLGVIAPCRGMQPPKMWHFAELRRMTQNVNKAVWAVETSYRMQRVHTTCLPLWHWENQRRLSSILTVIIIAQCRLWGHDWRVLCLFFDPVGRRENSVNLQTILEAEGDPKVRRLLNFWIKYVEIVALIELVLKWWPGIHCVKEI